MKRPYSIAFPDEIPTVNKLSERYINEGNISMSRGIVDFGYKVGDPNQKYYAIKNCCCTDANIKEALILRKLDHPNIVKTYDAF